MNGKSKPYAILVFGAPMSGKTRFASQFSERFDAPYLNLAEMREQHHITRKLALSLVQEFSKCRHTFIIEGAIDTEKQRDEIRQILIKNGYEPILIWVQTDLSAIKQRLKKKFKKLSDAKAFLENSYAKMEAPSDAEAAIVVSGKYTFETQCKNVLKSLSSRKLRK